MAIEDLTLQLLLALSFYYCSVSGATDCTLPWFGRVTSDRDAANLNIIGETKNISNYVCPTPIVGDPNKKYCCYKTRGEVECCDAQHFVTTRLVFFFIICFMILITCYIIYRMCYLWCIVFKHSQNGSSVSNLWNTDQIPIGEVHGRCDTSSTNSDAINALLPTILNNNFS